MLRNNVDEWKNNFPEEYGKLPGDWRYDTNEKEIKRYWEGRVIQVANQNIETVFTIGSAALHPDDKLDILSYSRLLDRVEKNIHSAQNRVKYTMNGFVISVGTYIKELTSKSIAVAEKIGKVDVFMGGTACKVPYAKEYINKSIDWGKIGNKRKTARC
jgi:hypothetical protein